MKLQADLANPRSLIEILSRTEHWQTTLDSDPLVGNTCAIFGCCSDATLSDADIYQEEKTLSCMALVGPVKTVISRYFHCDTIDSSGLQHAPMESLT